MASVCREGATWRRNSKAMGCWYACLRRIRYSTPTPQPTPQPTGTKSPQEAVGEAVGIRRPPKPTWRRLCISAGEVTQWEVFRVPNALEGAIRAAVSRTGYRLTCALLDEKGDDLMRITALRSNGSVYKGLGEVIYRHSEYPLGDIWWIGPVWWRERPGRCMPVFEVESTLEISQEDLGKVVKTVAFLEEDTRDGAEHGGSSGTKHKSTGSDRGSHEKPTKGWKNPN